MSRSSNCVTYGTPIKRARAAAGSRTQDMMNGENRQLLTLLGTLLVFSISYGRVVSYATSDPLGSLLTAQAVIEHQTVKLDAYTGNIAISYVGKLEKLPKGHGKFRNCNGHAYYAFPIGTSLYSMPFVWSALLQGHDMLDPASDEALQRLLSSLSSALTFLLILALAREFLSFSHSYVVGLAMVLGSPLIATMGTALWSSVYTTLFVLGALFLLVRAKTRASHPNAWVLAPLLFSAFLCRPTLAPFVVLAVCYTALAHRPVALRLVAFLMLQVLLFVGWSLIEFKEAVPPYYQLIRVPWLFREPAGRMIVGSMAVLLFGGYLLYRRGKNRMLVGGIHLAVLIFGVAILLCRPGIIDVRPPAGSMVFRALTALHGQLFSPARGLFIYCPVLSFVLIGTLARLERLLRDPLFVLVSLWLAAHCMVVSQPFWWHGGHCYGARLFVEIIPGITVLALLVMKRKPFPKQAISRVLKTTLAIAALFGIFVNSYQGLYNRHTAAWNTVPNIDDHTEYLFSWRFPQFLAGPGLNAAKEADHRKRVEHTTEAGYQRFVADSLSKPTASASAGAALRDS